MKYISPKDGRWRFECRCGFVYKFHPVQNEFFLVNEPPMCFKPFRYFSLDIPFWKGENMWDGACDAEQRALVLNSHVEWDEYRSRKFENPHQPRKFPAVQSAEIHEDVKINRDVAEILHGLNVKGCSV